MQMHVPLGRALLMYYCIFGLMQAARRQREGEGITFERISRDIAVEKRGGSSSNSTVIRDTCNCARVFFGRRSYTGKH